MAFLQDHITQQIVEPKKHNIFLLTAAPATSIKSRKQAANEPENGGTTTPTKPRTSTQMWIEIGQSKKMWSKLSSSKKQRGHTVLWAHTIMWRFTSSTLKGNLFRTNRQLKINVLLGQITEHKTHGISLIITWHLHHIFRNTLVTLK